MRTPRTSSSSHQSSSATFAAPRRRTNVGETERRDPLRRGVRRGEAAHGGLIEVIVVIVREEDEVHRRQRTRIPPRRGTQRRGPSPGNGRRVLAPDRIGEDVQSGELHEQRRVADPGDGDRVGGRARPRELGGGARERQRGRGSAPRGRSRRPSCQRRTSSSPCSVAVPRIPEARRSGGGERVDRDRGNPSRRIAEWEAAMRPGGRLTTRVVGRRRILNERTPLDVERRRSTNPRPRPSVP